MAELAPATAPVEHLRLDVLLRCHHPDNPKDHDIGGIIESIQTFGFVRNVMLNEEDGLLLFGHGTTAALEQMRQVGDPRPARIEEDTDGMWTVPTDRGLHIQADLAKAYVIADNQHAMAGGWDEPQLVDNLIELAKDDSLAGTGFDGDDVDRLIRMHRPELMDDLEPTFDRGLSHESLRDKWKTQRGQLWLIGPHRLLVGDTMEPQDMDWLMHPRDEGDALEADLTPTLASMVWTDPPYAIYGSSSGVSADVADDKMVQPFFRAVMATARDRTYFRAHIYVTCDWRSWATIWDAARHARVEVKNCILWDKVTPGMGNMWRNQHEFILFAANDFQETTLNPHTDKVRVAHHRTVKNPNIIRQERVESARKLHNAQKPVELITTCLEASSERGQVVLDPFLGTGSTMVAAETSGRVCYGMELEPRLAAVTLERMAGLGLEPVQGNGTAIEWAEALAAAAVSE